ncbi:Conserved_hypothetical protein [Hexamita inflata]|uniref:Uncharacterized protein n=1 Tax=Hexamita inflata TaxID=28002 RepID=A0AA86RDG0_9EUKA|nr:Conserved hypothetical protein [Hexamita inflata]
MIAFMLSLSELTRAEKKTMYNCFTTSADINLFADTLQITVTLTSTKSASCDIPHGVFVSLQIDSLGSYEPSAYVQDFAYDSPQQIRLACTDPVECAKLKAAESGTIVLETKTHATFVPAGSIRVSKGLSSSCFHDNDSFVELYQGAVVLVLYPTFTCKDSIASDNLGQLKLNTLSKVKMYITYTDNSISIHDQLAITIQQDLFVPTLKVAASSTPVRIKLENPTISKYFIQTMTNGVLSKDMILFQINIQQLTNDAVPILKNSQVTVNWYKLVGIPSLYNRFDMYILSNGFIFTKEQGPSATAVKNQMIALGITSYEVQYMFTTYDVTQTEQFRMRVFSAGASGFLPNSNWVHSTCEIRYPGQQCDLLLKQLNKYPSSALQVQIIYMYYKNGVQVLNYTKTIDNIYGSCFTTGDLTYNYKTKSLIIEFNQNTKSSSCQLVNNDALVVKILLGNNSQVLKTESRDFKAGLQSFSVSGFDLSLQPEIRVQFFKDGKIMDAIAMSAYQIVSDNTLVTQEIVITIKILAVNLGVVIAYLLWHFVGSKLVKSVPKPKLVNSFVQQADDDHIEV